jgi:hypothetical protein
MLWLSRIENRRQDGGRKYELRKRRRGRLEGGGGREGMHRGERAQKYDYYKGRRRRNRWMEGGMNGSHKNEDETAGTKSAAFPSHLSFRRWWPPQSADGCLSLELTVFGFVKEKKRLIGL